MAADVTGEIEIEGGVLVIKRIHVTYQLTAPEAPDDVIDRVHEVHKEGCPVYRSIHRAIDISTALQMT